MKTKIIACPNCYCGSEWDGKLEDFDCPNCEQSIPVSKMASSLVHLFCTPAMNVEGDMQRWAYDFLRFLIEFRWGDEHYIGRHDWVISGCPTDHDEICQIIEHGDGIEFTSINRLLHDPPASLPKDCKKQIGLAAVSRLKSDVSEHLLREILYYTLQSFPVKEAEDVLKDLKKQYPEIDGNPETRTGKTLNRALERCREEESATE